MSLSPIDRSHSTIYIFSYKNKTNFTLQSKVKIYKFYFTKKNFEIIFKKGKKNDRSKKSKCYLSSAHMQKNYMSEH